MRPGDIVLVPFPQTDLDEGKFRPALVVAIAPGRHGDLLLMQITSRAAQLEKGLFEPIEDRAPGFAETGLKITSYVRVTRLATVSRDLIAGGLGKLPGAAFERVLKKLHQWIG